MGVAALRNLIGLLLLLVWLLIVARVIVSWVDPRGRNAFSRTVILWSEPLLAPIRRFLPPMGGLDLSPMIVLIVLSFLIQAFGA